MFVLCGSWLHVSFLLHVKYTPTYLIVSYRIVCISYLFPSNEPRTIRLSSIDVTVKSPKQQTYRLQ